MSAPNVYCVVHKSTHLYSQILSNRIISVWPGLLEFIKLLHQPHLEHVQLHPKHLFPTSQEEQTRACEDRTVHGRTGRGLSGKQRGSKCVAWRNKCFSGRIVKENDQLSVSIRNGRR